MILEDQTVGVALEDNVALVRIGDEYHIIKADQARKAYLLRADGSKLERIELKEGALSLEQAAYLP